MLFRKEYKQIQQEAKERAYGVSPEIRRLINLKAKLKRIVDKREKLPYKRCHPQESDTQVTIDLSRNVHTLPPFRVKSKTELTHQDYFNNDRCSSTQHTQASQIALLSRSLNRPSTSLPAYRNECSKSANELAYPKPS